ncbi:MAG: PLDc_N domain-containing protein [Thermococci archaeon]|nr:PLDc_N domain-containing protein [Thermococci archaeon]
MDAGIFGLFGIFGVLWMLALVLVLAGIALTVWAIYDIFTNQKKMPDTEKLIWVIVVVFLGLIGVIVYYLVVKANGKYEERKYEGGSFEAY